MKQATDRTSPSLLNEWRLVNVRSVPSLFRADPCRRLGRIPEAHASYEKALALARQELERRFLARRLEELKKNNNLCWISLLEPLRTPRRASLNRRISGVLGRGFTQDDSKSW